MSIKPSKSMTTIVYAAGLFVVATMPFFWTGYFSNDGLKVPQSADAGSLGTQFSALAILGMILLFGLMFVMLKRRGKIIKLQKQLFLKQAQEVDFRQRAIDTHTIISASDADTKITDVNDNFVDVFGYTREGILGKKQSVLYPGGDQNVAYREARDTVASGKIWTGEQKLLKKNGTPIFVQCTIVPLFDEDGHYTGNISMRTDVTKQRVAEADKYLTSMLEKLQDEVYVFETDTLNITYMNELAQERCEWSADVSQTKKISDTSINFDVAIFRKHVEPLFSGEKKSVVIETKHEKGYVEISTRLYSGAKDVPVFVSILRDITERRLTEKRKLEAVSVVSHELRSPLTSIKGALQLLQSGVVVTPSADSDHILDIAVRNSDRLLRVVDDILVYEKIQAGKMTFTKNRFNLSEFLVEAASINKGYADTHNVTFVTVNMDPSAIVEGDRERLHQVMSNLMSNAAKYSPDGGTIELSIADGGDNWRISVSDKGPGIPASARNTIFDSFSQLKPVDGIKRKGTGLGLAITKKIVELHNGIIDFKSMIGEGTTFYFELPKSDKDGQKTSLKPMAIAAE